MARIVTLESTATTRPRKGNKRDHEFAKWLKQWRNKRKRISRSWKTRKVENVKRIRRTVRENNKNKDMSRVQSEMGKLTHHNEQELLSVWEGWHLDDNKGG